MGDLLSLPNQPKFFKTISSRCERAQGTPTHTPRQPSSTPVPTPHPLPLGQRGQWGREGPVATTPWLSDPGHSSCPCSSHFPVPDPCGKCPRCPSVLSALSCPHRLVTLCGRCWMYRRTRYHSYPWAKNPRWRWPQTQPQQCWEHITGQQGLPGPKPVERCAGQAASYEATGGCRDTACLQLTVPSPNQVPPASHPALEAKPPSHVAEAPTSGQLSMTFQFGSHTCSMQTCISLCQAADLPLLLGSLGLEYPSHTCPQLCGELCPSKRQVQS